MCVSRDIAVRGYLVAKLFFSVECLSGFTFTFFFGGGGEQGDQAGGVDPAVVVDVDRVEGVVDFLGGELVAPGHEGVSESAITIIMIVFSTLL